MSNPKFKKQEESGELISLNEQLYDEFFVQELESRLETDPLMVGGLLDSLTSDSDLVAGCFCDPVYCGSFSCGEKV
ncbi:MAG: hypothetical protein LBK47_10090 [Prevotellaceae bacterium]|jgi:hypothetical protein|nr:hypothetical protein [Prevotellaceae bacterium]